jgi:hypothetical protein
MFVMIFSVYKFIIFSVLLSIAHSRYPWGQDNLDSLATAALVLFVCLLDLARNVSLAPSFWFVISKWVRASG